MPGHTVACVQTNEITVCRRAASKQSLNSDRIEYTGYDIRSLSILTHIHTSEVQAFSSLRCVLYVVLKSIILKMLCIGKGIEPVLR